MRKWIWILLIVAMPALAHKADRANRPAWGFPATDKVQPSAPQDDKPKTLPGSAKSYTQAQIDDLKNPPDWFPDVHPPMPPVVAHGAVTPACGSCHLPTGAGHDESAYLAGLPASYIAGQMADFKSGAREGFGIMPDIARALNDDDVNAAAQYFASLPARPWIRVIETDTVPKTFVNPGHMRLEFPGGGSEPIGNRIVELPEDDAAAIARDPRSGFVAYVPKGSIAKGRTIVTGDGGRTTPCAACHGSDLTGMGKFPAIAGRHPGYIARQLYFFQSGSRSGPNAELMHEIVHGFTNDDMVATAAYLASLQP
jgi:cytochrome c553